MNTRLFYRLKRNRASYPEDWSRSYFSQDNVHLSAKAASSSIWLFSQAFAMRCLRLLVTAILARILFPEDFGLVSMAVIILGAVGLFSDFGFGTAIVYKQYVSQLHLSTAFWFNIAISIILCGLCVLLSPLAELYYKNPHIQSVIIVISLTFIITGLGSINGTILTKQLSFNKIAIIGFVSTVIGRSAALISIILLNAGYWGLIIGELFTVFALTFFRYLYTGWYPFFLFDIQALKEMFHYGKNILFTGFVNYFSANVDYFIVGRRLGFDSLGLYLFAYSIPHVILRQFSQVLSRILFPVLCKVNDDSERFNRGYLKAIKFVSLISFPITIGMLCVADHFIYVLYGERWMGAVVPFQILCLSGMSKSILTTMGSVFKAKGRPDIDLKWNLVVFPIIAISVYIGSHYGLTGVALAMTFTSYLSFIAMWICLRLAGITFLSYLLALAPAFFGSLVMSLFVFYVDYYVLPKYGLPHLVSLLILTSIGMFIYAICVFWFNRKTMVELIYFIKTGIKGK